MTLLILTIVVFTMLLTFIAFYGLKPKDLKQFDEFECFVDGKNDKKVNRVRRPRK